MKKLFLFCLLLLLPSIALADNTKTWWLDWPVKGGTGTSGTTPWPLTIPSFGSELVTNSTFESGVTTGWLSYGQSGDLTACKVQFVANAVAPLAGSFDGQLTDPEGDAEANVYQAVSLTAGKVYRLSTLVKADSGHVGVRVVNNNNYSAPAIDGASIIQYLSTARTAVSDFICSTTAVDYVVMGGNAGGAFDGNVDNVSLKPFDTSSLIAPINQFSGSGYFKLTLNNKNCPDGRIAGPILYADSLTDPKYGLLITYNRTIQSIVIRVLNGTGLPGDLLATVAMAWPTTASGSADLVLYMDIPYGNLAVFYNNGHVATKDGLILSGSTIYATNVYPWLTTNSKHGIFSTAGVTPQTTMAPDYRSAKIQVCTGVTAAVATVATGALVTNLAGSVGGTTNIPPTSFSGYEGRKILIADKANQAAIGYVRTAGTGAETLSADMFDVGAGTFDVGVYSWVPYGTNVVANDAGQLKITYGDNPGGGYTSLTLAGDFNAAFPAGAVFKVIGETRISAGSAAVRVWKSAGLYQVLWNETQLSLTSHTAYFSITSLNDFKLNLDNLSDGESMWLDNFTMFRVTGPNSTGFTVYNAITGGAQSWASTGATFLSNLPTTSAFTLIIADVP